MPYPVVVDQVPFETAEALTEHLASSAQPLSPLLTDLLERGALTTDEAYVVLARLIQMGPVRALCQAARLAVALEARPLARFLVHAAVTRDPGVLMGLDPEEPHRSAEDVLLTAAVRLITPEDARLRAILLERLRIVGLPGLELPLLCAHGSPQELEQWLPAVFAEGLEATDIGPIAARLSRGDEGADVIRRALELLEEGARAAVLAAVGQGSATPPEA